MSNSLYDDLMAPTQKEYAWSGRVRERVLLQIIKIEKHDCTTPSLKNNSYAEDIRQAHLTANVSMI
jgi:hypothetical protein